MNWKLLAGIVLGVCSGVACRALDIPSPAPPALFGSLRVGAMTIGYVATDAFAAKRRRRSRPRSGDPTGRSQEHEA